MICLSVHKNGVFVCNAGMPGLAILTATIRASRYDAAAGSVDITGLQDLPDQRSAQVAWVRDSLLKPGDSLVFILINHDEPDAPIDVKPRDSAALLPAPHEQDTLHQAPAASGSLLPPLHASLAFKLAAGNQEVTARLPDSDGHMACTLLWDKWQPERCTISASSSPGMANGDQDKHTQWLEAELQVGDSFEFTVLD